MITFKRVALILFCILLVTSPSSPLLAQQSWPDFTELENYPNPNGNSCPDTGNGQPGSEKAESNKLKNRFRLPSNGQIETLAYSELLNLPFEDENGEKINSSDPNNGRFVSFTGYVRKVKYGGRSESCNCKATIKEFIDTHIEVIPTPDTVNDPTGSEMVVVEVTERSRRLAKDGLLHSNIGNDWSNSVLVARLEGRTVTFKGWLFYDGDHHLEGWNSDPENISGRANWRATAWEIHPVMSIEVTPGRFSPLVSSRASIVDAIPASQWPDLSVLSNFAADGGDCGPNGSATPSSEKARSNELKNRFRLPSDNIFKPIRLSTLFDLNSGTLESPPLAADPNNLRAVSVTGYVKEVKPGGTRGESCNCKARGRAQVDAHIEIVLDPNVNDPTGKGMVVVEVTERSRRLAALGLLKSNIGNDWSTPKLRAQLLGRRVTFSGWLFYDNDHHSESWTVDPDNSEGGNNWRQTCWEIHPVLGIKKTTGHR